ncbi:MAG TPA: hypothetical protein VGI47_00830 [Candidatus Binataceae bacterium]
MGAVDYPGTKGEAGSLYVEIERIRKGVEPNRARRKVCLGLRRTAVSTPSPKAGYRIIKLLSSVLPARIRAWQKKVRGGVKREQVRDASADCLLIRIAFLAEAPVRLWPVAFIALPLTGLIAAPAPAALARLALGFFIPSGFERSATVAGANIISAAPGAPVAGCVIGPEIAKLSNPSWMPML